MAHCFVTRRLPGNALDRVIAEGHELDVWPADMPPLPGELRDRAAGADGLLCLLTDRIDSELFDAAPRLRVVANYAVGCDNIDLDAARARNIAVGVTPDVLTNATADLTLALILAAARRLPQAMAAVRNGEWRTWQPAGWLGMELHGATLGIVGRGRIGDAVAHRAEGFGMTILSTGSANRPTPLDELLATADVVSLHCPLTPATHHLIDADALGRMRPTAILVNTARGAIVDSLALATALRARTIAAAALDVTDPEPPPLDHPLLAPGTPNLLIVPHIASATTTARHRMADLAVDNLLAGLAGAPLPHPAR